MFREDLLCVRPCAGVGWVGLKYMGDGEWWTMVPPLPSNVLEMVIHLLAECRVNGWVGRKTPSFEYYMHVLPMGAAGGTGK